MKRKLVYPALCFALLLVFLFSLGGTLAAWAVQSDTVNIIQVGSVKGRILEDFEQNQTVYPQTEVTNKVKVENTGTLDSVVRVKISKVWGASRDQDGNLVIDPELSVENIKIAFNTDNWYYEESDGYFYYKGVLEPGEATETLFDSFFVDGYLTGDEYRRKIAEITVYAECVQAAGNGISYWNQDFEKLGIEYTASQTVSIVTSAEFISPNNGFTFKLNNGDLFTNFKNLAPGETRSQTIEVKNSWSKAVEISLWADFIDQNISDADKDLIEKLLREYATIVITDQNGNVIYNGPVWGSPDLDSTGTDSMKYPYSLGTFKPGESRLLNISLSLSSSVGNEYINVLGLIKWVFSAADAGTSGTGTDRDNTNKPKDHIVQGGDTSETEADPGITDQPGAQGDADTPETKTDPGITDQPGAQEYPIDVPKTGDQNNPLPYMITMMISGGMLIFLFVKKKKADNKNSAV